MSKGLFALMLAVLACTATAQAPTPEQIENERRLLEMKNAMDALERLGEEASSKRKLDCLMAIGDEAFCQCVDENLGYMVAFPLYVAVMAEAITPSDYAELDSQAQGIVDAARRSRKACVG